ncbi:MAG: type II toxin-antitoxin system HicB family antitoxin [Solidesulfovibrio sp.]
MSANVAFVTGSNHMKYGDYVGTVEFDIEHKRLFGRVVGISDKISYEGNTLIELENDFKESIDEYIEFCKEMGKKPDKSFSGKILFRTNPELHSRIASNAQRQGKSVNSWLNDLISKEVYGPSQSECGNR